MKVNKLTMKKGLWAGLLFWVSACHDGHMQEPRTPTEKAVAGYLSRTLALPRTYKSLAFEPEHALRAGDTLPTPSRRDTVRVGATVWHHYQYNVNGGISQVWRCFAVYRTGRVVKLDSTRQVRLLLPGDESED
jgi:hypothetical protein